MTQWTPKLEEEIKKYAEQAEKGMIDYLNPDISVAGTFLRLVFRDIVKVRPVYKKICAEMGLVYSHDLKSTVRNMQSMVDLAKHNGSHVADKLERALAANKQVDAIGDRSLEPFEVVKKVKQAHMHL